MLRPLVVEVEYLRTERQSAPECQKIKNGGLDQYSAGPFEQQQFETAGVERARNSKVVALLTFVAYVQFTNSVRRVRG